MTLRRREGASGSDPRVRIARPFRVLAFDPGGTTGVASATFDADRLLTLDQIKFDSDQIGPYEHHHELYLALDRWNDSETGIPGEIVCESFQFRQHINQSHDKTKVELVSCEYIGIIKLFSVQHFLDLTFYTASAAKTLVTDKKIKQLGLWQPGQPHAMDAMRHLLRYIVVHKKIRSPITDRWLEG